MKGENILYNNLVPNSLDELNGGVKNQRNSFLEKRSNAMACRFYYHSTLCRLRYDDCLLSLSAEFFLEPDTIIGHLKNRIGFVNDLIKRKLTPADLRREYPFYDWSAKAPVIKPSAAVKFTSAGNPTLF